MSQTVDVRGLSCPVPVIRTKEALEAITQGEIVVLLDEEVAKENVTRLAHSLGCAVQATTTGDEFKLTLVKERERQS